MRCHLLILFAGLIAVLMFSAYYFSHAGKMQTGIIHLMDKRAAEMEVKP